MKESLTTSEEGLRSPEHALILQAIKEGYKPWGATPMGSPLTNPIVNWRFESHAQQEAEMIAYGYNDPEFNKMAPYVEKAIFTRNQARLARAGEARCFVLHPERPIAREILTKAELGLAEPHELLYIMTQRGMQSIELGKVTHLYGGERLNYARTMKAETMALLNDLSMMSAYLENPEKNNLNLDQLQYAKTVEDLELLEGIISTSGASSSVEIMDSLDHTYFRLAGRDWDAPMREAKVSYSAKPSGMAGSPMDNQIISFKRKSRLGKVGQTEIVMRTSFMVNLDEKASSIDTRVLQRVKALNNSPDFSEKILSDQVGLIKEIERVGLDKDPYSFILVSSTVYAKNANNRHEIEKMINQSAKENRFSETYWTHTYEHPTVEESVDILG